jgi:hypothetical protein
MYRLLAFSSEYKFSDMFSIIVTQTLSKETSFIICASRLLEAVNRAANHTSQNVLTAG